MTDLVVGLCLIAVVVCQGITNWKQAHWLRRAWAREDEYRALLETLIKGSAPSPQEPTAK